MSAPRKSDQEFGIVRRGAVRMHRDRQEREGGSHLIACQQYG
jgi:hypothetical protein